MIKRLSCKAKIPKKTSDNINSVRPFKGGEWDKPPESIKVDVDLFKSILKTQLFSIQSNECAYCGLTLNVTGRSEIEHIAPKGGAIQPKYVAFTFTPTNLVLACNFCNSPQKKGKKDTVEKYDAIYAKCEFNIVHPYYDEPDLNYSWVKNEAKVIISGITPKGLKSIEIFSLDSPQHTEARAKQELYANLTSFPGGFDFIDAVLNYKPK